MLFACVFTGTVISGVIAFFLTRGDMTLMNRTSILCVNCFVGIMQLSTIVFLMIGWIWSIVWGCAFVGLSGKYPTSQSVSRSDSTSDGQPVSQTVRQSVSQTVRQSVN